MNQGVMVGGRRPLVEDDLQWKTTSVGRRPLVEDDFWWKTTFGGRRPLVEDDFWWKTILACCLIRFAAFIKNNVCSLRSGLGIVFVTASRVILASGPLERSSSFFLPSYHSSL